MTTGERRKGGERRLASLADGIASVPTTPPISHERRRVERRRVDHAGAFVDRRQFHRPQRVLIVDDDADVRAVWRDWLTLWRFTVIEAENGSVAIDRIRERRPDVVIMDVTMPVLDGFGATARLKAEPGSASLPILLLSADTEPSAAARARQSGGDVFLGKPIRAGELLEEIRRAFRRLAEARDATLR